MSLPVTFDEQALADLQEIYDYIAPRAGERIAADYVSRLYRYCAALGAFPERGMRRFDIRPRLRIVGFNRQATIATELTDTELRILRILGRGRDVGAAFEID